MVSSSTASDYIELHKSYDEALDVCSHTPYVILILEIFSPFFLGSDIVSFNSLDQLGYFIIILYNFCILLLLSFPIFRLCFCVYGSMSVPLFIVFFMSYLLHLQIWKSLERTLVSDFAIWAQKVSKIAVRNLFF